MKKITYMWQIVHESQCDDETGEKLFWSNKLGFTNSLDVEIYTSEEKEKTNLPIGGEWFKIIYFKEDKEKD